MFKVGNKVTVRVVGLNAKFGVAVAFAVFAPKKPREGVRYCGLTGSVTPAYGRNAVAELYGYASQTLKVYKGKAF